MPRIDRYIMLQFGLGMIPMMLLLLSVFSLLALAEALKSVGEGSYELLDAIAVVALTTPRRFVDLLPVSALLGCLMGLGAMANHNELVVMRAAGISVPRMARPVVLMALALAGLIVALQFFAIPPAERKAVQVRSKSLQQTEVGSGKALQFWTRSEDYFVRVREVAFERSLRDVEIYRIAPSGNLTQLYQAGRADFVGANDWLLRDVVYSDLNQFEVREEKAGTLHWPGLLTPKQVETLIVPVEALTPSELFRYIRYLSDNQLNTHRYRIIFWQQLSVPVALLAMSVLSLPLLIGSVRHIPAGQRIMIGAAIGMGFYLLQQITGNLAGLLGLPPHLTIMAPSLLLLAIAAYGIHRL